MSPDVAPNSPVLVRVEHLEKHFPIAGGLVVSRQIGTVKAVDGVSFAITRGETLGLVGESGCGKSTTGRASCSCSGHRRPGVLRGCRAEALSDEELRPLRPKMQMIFQDPYASLNPRHSVAKIVGEPLVIHKAASGQALRDRVVELLELVGLKSVHLKRFPHEFSGGQRQRIGIARALALHPSFIVCDEPISALDVSIQAQVVNLLEDLQAELGLTYLFIAHDLSMVRHISHRVAVMYLGKIAELADRRTLFEQPLHPYTQSLMSAVPIPAPKKERMRQRIILAGEVPSPADPPSGCVFHTRCPIAVEQCRTVEPGYHEVTPGHFVSCHTNDTRKGSDIRARAAAARRASGRSTRRAPLRRWGHSRPASRRAPAAMRRLTSQVDWRALLPDLALLTAGSALMAVNLNLFLAPADIAPGGVLAPPSSSITSPSGRLV
jgi:oligopeptide transport system ATP-binding protein